VFGGWVLVVVEEGSEGWGQVVMVWPRRRQRKQVRFLWLRWLRRSRAIWVYFKRRCCFVILGFGGWGDLGLGLGLGLGWVVILVMVYTSVCVCVCVCPCVGSDVYDVTWDSYSIIVVSK